MAKKTKTSLVKSADAKKIMEKQGAECSTSPELLKILQKNMATFDLLKSKFDNGVIPDDQFVNIEEVDADGSDMSEIKTQISDLTALVEGLAKNAKPKETKTDDDADGDADEAKKAEELAKAAASIAAQIASEVLVDINERLSKVDSIDWKTKEIVELSKAAMAKLDNAPEQDVIDAAVEILTKNIEEIKTDEDETDEEKAKKAELAKAELEKSAPVGFSMDLSPALPGNNE